MIEKLSSLAEKYFKQSAFDHAEEIAHIILEEDRMNVPVRCLLAYVYLFSGRADLAVTQAQSALQVAEATGNGMESARETLQKATVENDTLAADKNSNPLYRPVRHFEFTDKFFMDLVDEIENRVKHNLEWQRRAPLYLRDPKFRWTEEMRNRWADRLTPKFMEEATSFPDSYEHRLFALNLVKLDGLNMEFGVFEGGSINFMARNYPDKNFYGFDSFEGLPEPFLGHPVGYLTREGELPPAERNVTYVKGWFADTLPEFAKEHSENVAFMHIDSDLYSSAVTIFENFGDQIVPGTVIVFDQYFDEERMAFEEFAEKKGIEYRFLGYHLFSETEIVENGQKQSVLFPSDCHNFYRSSILSVSVIIESVG